MPLLERLREALAPTYEIERELGSGGMGTVFLASDPNLDRKVTIKGLRPDLSSEVARRLGRDRGPEDRHLGHERLERARATSMVVVTA